MKCAKNHLDVRSPEKLLPTAYELLVPSASIQVIVRGLGPIALEARLVQIEEVNIPFVSRDLVHYPRDDLNLRVLFHTPSPDVLFGWLSRTKTS